MKDTKGVRQVLEEVHKAHYYTIDGTDGCNVSIEKAESALQEIMLGMLPEKKEKPDTIIKLSQGDTALINGDFMGWNNCRTQIEQNIRGGFNNG